MRRFLVVFDNLEIEKSAVKAGRNSPEAVTAARCVNVGLFVSGELRRDVIVSLAKRVSDSLCVVSFDGKHLKRVSPDERSVSFFLMKAFDEVNNLEIGQVRKMDNGIVVDRRGIESFLDDWRVGTIFCAEAECEEWPSSVSMSTDALYIYMRSPSSDLLEEIRRGVTPLPRPPHPERFLLDLNLIADGFLRVS